MKIAQHSIILPAAARVPAQSTSARTASTASGQAGKEANSFAVLVNTRLPVESSGGAGAGRTPLTAGIGTSTSTATTTPATVNPLAGWVTCGPAPANQAGSAAGTSSSTAQGSTASGSSTVTAPAQPGIGALISAIMDGSFQPTYLTTSQLAENTPSGLVFNSPAYYASDQTAQQLATLLGGTVVKQVPFPSSNAATTEIKANFIQLPSGQTVNAADLAYYAKFGGYGAQQLAADLTQEINQGGAISSYNQQMVAYLNGTGNLPGEMPAFQPNSIGPAIAGMTYPPGTLAADGSVINPMAHNG